jgi:hypothetical protein
LAAIRKDNAEIAALYLNTPLRGEDAQNLAREVAVVIDRRLPARLNEISEKPEGAVPDPLRPDEDLVGTVTTSRGDLDIVVERIDRGKLGKVWLFSRKTLDSIPEAFDEISTPPVEALLPQFLVKTRLGSIPLFHWLAIFVGVPLLYFVTGLLNRFLIFVAGLRHVRQIIRLEESSGFPSAHSATAGCDHDPLDPIQIWTFVLGTAILVHIGVNHGHCCHGVVAHFAERLGRASRCAAVQEQWICFGSASCSQIHRRHFVVRWCPVYAAPFRCEPDGRNGRPWCRRYRSCLGCPEDPRKCNRRYFSDR